MVLGKRSRTQLTGLTSDDRRTSRCLVPSRGAWECDNLAVADTFG